MDIRVEHTPDKGRRLVATRPFVVGEVVARQLPYAAVLFNDNAPHFCNYCYRKEKDLYRCSRSKFARYCSQKHQILDWNEGYQNECDFIVRSHPRIPPASIRLAAHVVWKRKRELEEGTNERGSWNGYDGIDALTDHWDILPEDRKKTFTEMGLFMSKVCPNLPDEGLSLDEPAPKSYARLLAKFLFNNHTISCSSITSLGCGVFPLLSMVNHSSWPNCIQRFDGKRCEFRAIRSIQEGDEITITYIDLISTSLEMQEILQRDYLFDMIPQWNKKNLPRKMSIDSTLDVNLWKRETPCWVVSEKDSQLTTVKSEKGPTVGLSLVMHELDNDHGTEWEYNSAADKAKKRSDDRGRYLFTVHLWGEWAKGSKNAIVQIAKRSRTIQEAMNEGEVLYDRRRFNEAAELLQKTLNLCQTPLGKGYSLSENHVIYIRTIDLLRKVTVDSGQNWNLAMEYYRFMVDHHDLLFPRYWSERGSQLAGLAKLETNYGDIKHAMKLAEEAVRILRVTDGSGEVLEEMRDLAKNLQHEISFRQQQDHGDD